MMDDLEILQIVAEELSQSAGGNDNEFIDSNRKEALAYYLGQPNGTEVEGRSTVTSTDVADAIEWIMPEVMEQIAKTDKIVTFDATGPEDENQAELESAFVYSILMKKNHGFITLHQVIKDALMQKNGITKTYYESIEEVNIRRYTGIGEDEMNFILNDDRVELLQMSEEVDDEAFEHMRMMHQQQMMQYQQMVVQLQAQGQQPPPPPPEPEAPLMYDIKVSITDATPTIRVDPIPPEEFRINRQHNTPNPADARFTAHVVLRTASDLIKSGIPKDVVDGLDHGYTGNDHDRDYRFYMQNETVYPNRDATTDPSMFMYEIAECYMHIDLDGDGIAEFMKIEVAGGDNPTDILRMEKMDVREHPFTSYTAILMSHKFFGLSIFDRLKQLQDQKTALWRNIFDNLYLQNNQRMAVLEGQVNLDDMLVSRPGGIIRQLAPGAIEPIVTPSIGQDAYQMMEYLDQVRAGRVGVNPEGPLNIQDLGNRVGSEGVAQLMTAREAVVGLIIAVIAETGVRPQMYLIRNIARNHLDTVQNFKFRGQWREIHPSNWENRTDTTAHIGTGSGNTQAQLMAVQTVIEGQMGIMASNPGQTLVQPENLFKSWSKFCDLAGLKAPDAFFTDPQSPTGKQLAQDADTQQEEMAAKDEEMRVSQLEMQAKISNAEMGKAQATMKNVELEAQLDAMKIELDQAKATADVVQADEELDIERNKIRSNEKIKFAEMDSKERIAECNARAKERTTSSD